MVMYQMVRKYLVASIIILLLTSYTIAGTAQNIEKISLISITGHWFYVGGNGPGNYTTIQSAIDVASSGDTVFVYKGIYTQSIVINTNQLTIIGQDKYTTVINCNQTYDISQITINASNCSIQNLQITLINDSIDKKGISIHSSYNIIQNTIITNVTDAIELIENAEANIIRNNELQNNTIGIDLSGASFNIINHNNISNNSQYDIYLTETSDYNTISFNILNTSNFGIRIAGSKYNQVFKNTIQNNQIGLYCCCHSRSNYFYTNNFIQNIINGKNDYGLINTWYDVDNSSGNYWDDYIGLDTDGDGMGDAPYKIPGGDRQDSYPLMHPFELYYQLNISLENHEIYETNLFNVTVNTRGGTTVSEAQVFFNGQTTLTNAEGIVQLTAPTVLEDLIIPIFAIKKDYIPDNDTMLIKNMQNKPPHTPIITGEANGTIKTLYDYLVQTTDPEQDDIQYIIDWGDNTTITTGFNASGAEISVSHTWDTKGTYIVKVKAIDAQYAASDWATLTITMPLSNFRILQHLYGSFQNILKAFLIVQFHILYGRS